MTFADKVKLQLLSVEQTIVIDGDGPRTLKGERLFVNFKIHGQVTWYDGLFDTGAMISILPHRIWSKSEIEWVHPLPGQTFPDWVAKITGITGGEVRCQLGIATLQFCDVDRRHLRPVRAFVKCLAEGHSLPRSLIGLGGSVLDERRVEIERHHEGHSAWLSELWAGRTEGEWLESPRVT